MTEEIWKNIIWGDGSPSLYEISSLGRVRRISGGRWGHLAGKELKPYKTKDGYYRIGLHKPGEKNTIGYLIHRLIAIAFIENPNNEKIINHKDGIKTNNSIDNLEWCDTFHNMRHAFRTGLIVAPKFGEHPEAKKVLGTSKDGKRSIIYPSTSKGEEDGFAFGCISACALGKRLSHKGFNWQYI